VDSQPARKQAPAPTSADDSYRVQARDSDSRAEVENSVAHAAPALPESKRPDLSAPHSLLARAFTLVVTVCPGAPAPLEDRLQFGGRRVEHKRRHSNSVPAEGLHGLRIGSLCRVRDRDSTAA
jgi:hypothetical protein